MFEYNDHNPSTISCLSFRKICSSRTLIKAMLHGAVYSRESVRALEEAVAGAQRVVHRNPALPPLLTLAQEKLQVCNVCIDCCILYDARH